MKNNKEEVLYLRVDSNIKGKLKELCYRKGMTISKYLRGIIIQDISNTSPTRAFLVIQELEKELMNAHTQLGYDETNAREKSIALQYASAYLETDYE